MKLSVIIPCHPRSRPTLPRTLQSLERAASGFDVQTIVVDDTESRGLSWARNEGLSRAEGEVVFFVDADDTVQEDYFRRLSLVLEESGADFVISNLAIAPLHREYDLMGNEAVRSALLPAFFGYSLEDIRRWNAGGDLRALRELGSVCRCAFRRSFLETWHIRFDEKLFVFEDAPFLAECAARATRVKSIPDTLYDYVPGEGGILATYHSRYFDYKFVALENRKAMATRVGEDVMEHFRGSAVFSALELLLARKGALRYIADPFVAESLRRCPCSWRHPLFLAGVWTLRLLKVFAHAS